MVRELSREPAHVLDWSVGRGADPLSSSEANSSAYQSWEIASVRPS